MTIQRIPITDRAQWLGLRKNDVTASVIGALFGYHPYKTAFSLFAEKCGLEAAADEQEETALMRRGRRIESAVAEETNDLRPDWVLTKATEYLRDPDARIGATPDFYYLDESGRIGVLQAKTVNPRSFKEHWSEAPPDWICLQTATEMMLAGAECGQIAALVVGDFEWRVQLFDIPRHERAEARLREAVAKFWANVAAGVPPALDYGRDQELIKLIHKTVEPAKVIDLRADNYIPELLAKHQQTAESLKKLETEKKAIEAEIFEKMGDCEVGIVTGWRLTNKRINVDGYTKTVEPYSYPRLYIKKVAGGAP